VFSTRIKGKAPAESAGNVSGDKTRELEAALKERDAAIDLLDQTISEQIAQIETLRQALEDAKFKSGILEQSYSTQLREARGRAAAAEQSLSDQQNLIQELESTRNELNKELSAARSRLDSFGRDEPSIDDLLESFTMSQETISPRRSDDLIDRSADPQTHEDMLAPDVMLAGKNK